MSPLPSDYDDFDPYHCTSWANIEYQVDTSPRLYLDFAIKDLEFEKSGRTLVNSLSNAKRALHLQASVLAEHEQDLFAGSLTKRMLPDWFSAALQTSRQCGR